jgi:hypothetical protein
MKRIEDILAQCIEDVKAGRCSVEDCLSRYPAVSRELQPLLRLALNIQQPPDVKPSPAFKVKARVHLMEQIHAKQSVTKWPWLRYTGRMKPILHIRRFSMVTTIIAAVLAISTLGGGTALAAQGSLPGDVLYGVKLGTEKVGLIFADEAADAELWLKYADTRLEEIGALDEKGRPEEIEVAVNGYDEAIAMAMAKVDAVSARGLQVGELSALVAEATQSHLIILDGLADAVPEEAQEAIARAGEASIIGYENALRALAGENPGKATEINLAAMEGRLNRAQAEAEAGDFDGVAVALTQFEELSDFGEEISQIAQGLGLDTTTIEQLVAEATSIQLEILAIVYDTVPEAAQEAVESAMENSVIGYQEAVEALENKGALGEIPVEPPIPEGIPVEPSVLEGTPTPPEGTPTAPPRD